MYSFRLTILFCLFSFTGFSQVEEAAKTIMISGDLYDMQSLEKIPYVNISVNNNYTLISDHNGHFQMNIPEIDSLVIRHRAYETASIAFRNSDFTGDTFNLDIFLKLKVIQITEAIILPFTTYDEFKDALIHLNRTGSHNLNRNIDNLMSQINGNYMPEKDGYANFKHMMLIRDKNNNALTILSTNPDKGLLFGGLNAILKKDWILLK